MLNQKWESVYSRGEQLNSWPFTDLVSLFMRHKPQLIRNKQHHGPMRVLELGFGAGNNIEFFQSQGIEYNGIEFSETAYNVVLQKFPQLDRNNFKLGSFTETKNYEDGFDAHINYFHHSAFIEQTIALHYYFVTLKAYYFTGIFIYKIFYPAA